MMHGLFQARGALQTLAPKVKHARVAINFYTGLKSC